MIFLIPIFLLSIGFPKEIDDDIRMGIGIRITESEICKLIKGFGDESCNSTFNNYEVQYSRNITKFAEKKEQPRNLNVNLIICFLSISTGFLTVYKNE